MNLLGKRTKYYARKWHAWGAMLVVIPLLVMTGTGVLLMLKKQSEWIQPSTARGSGSIPEISFEKILEATANHPRMGVSSWADIDRLDVRPSKGIVKVRSHNRWEVQLDLLTGATLQAAYRRSDLIEAIHDGSWFHDGVKYFLFLPAGLILLFLSFSGVYMFFVPMMTRLAKRRKAPVAPSHQQKISTPS